jgi:hypothetical protein
VELATKKISLYFIKNKVKVLNTLTIESSNNSYIFTIIYYINLQKEDSFLRSSGMELFMFLSEEDLNKFDKDGICSFQKCLILMKLLC